MALTPMMTPSKASGGERKVYIVYMGSIGEPTHSTSTYHFSMLQEVVEERFVSQALMRSYTRSFNGFAANLTAQERDKLARHEEVVSIFPSTKYYPQTTRSWDFMGFHESVRRNHTTESNIIVGIIDSGVWPESPIFNDEGFGPPPKKWKGVCHGGENFTCNNKLIGARAYRFGHEASMDDKLGHGTHTASVVAGNPLKGASFYGLAEGTSRGAVPSARIAAYQVCYPVWGCWSDFVLAAFDDAIADGVDIINLSVASIAIPLDADPVAIASLHATQKGILVVQAAGNQEKKGKVGSIAPWVFTIAASTIDRGIITKVALPNGTSFIAKSINSFDLEGKTFPLVYGKGATNSCSDNDARYCGFTCLTPSLIEGKIVLCNIEPNMENAALRNAVGAIVPDAIRPDDDVVPFPAAILSEQDFEAVKSYYFTERAARVSILPSESVKNLDAPRIAEFSSKGPNTILPDLMKPDVAAPGVEILAAYPPNTKPTHSVAPDKRRVMYNILSGTSTSCAHVSGAAAYVKSMHPNWSPSAIKSALMTTAWRMNATLDPLGEFSYGVGHIDPVKAVDPGLVYEISSEDYAEMLCGLDISNGRINRVFGGNSSCPSETKLMPKDLNLPSMTVRLPRNLSKKGAIFSEKFTRIVTNVGIANSTYKVSTSKSSDYNITVAPNVLAFEELNQKKSFEVFINGKVSGSMISATLEWSDGVRRVRSPIVVYQYY